MEIYQQTLEMRGQKRQVFVDYFLTLDGSWMEGPNGFIRGPEWQVRLSEEQILQMGPISLPVVWITFEANKELALALIQAFRMRFLSAGG